MLTGVKEIPIQDSHHLELTPNFKVKLSRDRHGRCSADARAWCEPCLHLQPSARHRLSRFSVRRSVCDWESDKEVNKDKCQ